MALSDLLREFLPQIEIELKEAVNHPLLDIPALTEMLAYHMGWSGEGAGPGATGKRIRPVLVLLAAYASGGDWRKALPAAAAVELIHNFSLIHDDIQDNSAQRRGRPTVWMKWGKAQAINTGDLMFTLGFAAMQRGDEFISAEVVNKGQAILQETCIQLTRGQYLDMWYEGLSQISLGDYWRMVGGKTAALLAACARLGVLFGGADENTQQGFYNYGWNLGLAFQVWDDWLGIWGNEQQTGKSISSDLLAGKKTYPILLALMKDGAFSNFMKHQSIDRENLGEAVLMLEKDGAREETEQFSTELLRKAESALEKCQIRQRGIEVMEEFNALLVKRER